MRHSQMPRTQVQVFSRRLQRGPGGSSQGRWSDQAPLSRKWGPDSAWPLSFAPPGFFLGPRGPSAMFTPLGWGPRIGLLRAARALGGLDLPGICFQELKDDRSRPPVILLGLQGHLGMGPSG